MDNEATSNILGEADAAYERCCQRLKEDLGLDEEAVEVILNLRNQVTALQARLQSRRALLKLPSAR